MIEIKKTLRYGRRRIISVSHVRTTHPNVEVTVFTKGKPTVVNLDNYIARQLHALLGEALS